VIGVNSTAHEQISFAESLYISKQLLQRFYLSTTNTLRHSAMEACPQPSHPAVDELQLLQHRLQASLSDNAALLQVCRCC
jgi:hypothetical protein